MKFHCIYDMYLHINKLSVWLLVIGLASILAYIYLLHKLVKQLDSEQEVIRIDLHAAKAELRLLSLRVGDLLVTHTVDELDRINEEQDISEISPSPDLASSEKLPTASEEKLEDTSGADKKNRNKPRNNPEIKPDP